MQIESLPKKTEYINFKLGGSVFAVNVEAASDIVELVRLSKLPVQLREIAGIFLKDGLVTVAIDLAQFYGLSDYEISDKMVIIIKWQEQQYGLVIDSIVNIGSLIQEARLVNLEEIFRKIEQGLVVDSLRD